MKAVQVRGADNIEYGEDATPKNLLAALRSGIECEILDRPVDRALYSTDASSYRIIPAGIALPRNTDDVAQVVKITRQHGGSVVPRGGGTSLSGQSVGPGVVIDLSKHMNRVIEINAGELWAEVQAGITLGALNTQLAPFGLKVGPDPASGAMATLGGMTGNNSTGAHSILYGMMVDHVKEIEVVLSDGSLVRFSPKTPEQIAPILRGSTLEAEIYKKIPALVSENEAEIKEKYPKTWRNVAGYNLNQIHRQMSSGEPLNLASLIVGSEGTLGVITAVRVGLVAVPKHTSLSILHFDTLREGMNRVAAILEHSPAAVELIDDYLLSLSASSPEWGAMLPNYFLDHPEIVPIVEFYGDTVEDLAKRAKDLEAGLRRQGFEGDVVHLDHPGDIENIWNIRKAGAGLLQSKRGDAKPLTFVDDAAVSIEDLPAFADEMVQLCEKLGAHPALIGHASAGCIHISPTLNTKTEEGIAKMRQLSEQIMALAIKYNGSTTGEHGEGIARSHFNEKLYGPQLHRAFRQVKGIFDPENVMNPGKIIDAPEPWDPRVIRLNPSYSPHLAPQTTWLDFSADGGFAGAVEMCTGQGYCRKGGAGIMCPSYRATRDERHSTRGRANALRSAISGELGVHGMVSEGLYEVLDLCLECKACQRECPSVVDMTKLKSEFLAQYQAEKGIPLRSRIFANINAINKLSALPVIRDAANWAFKNNYVRKVMETGLGISSRRRLPKLTGNTFTKWFSRRSKPNRASKKKVILWDDTFLTYNEPEVGIAAVKLLEAAGLEVEILRSHGCCGRPMISKGLLEQARQAAKKNVDLLIPLIDQGIPVVGLEPSCVSAFRDEYPSLLRSESATRVAENTFFFEEFFNKILGENEIEFNSPEAPQAVHVHGHCHQRTLIGDEAMIEMLGRLPNTTVHPIDSGCCGMAGSFGYETEHYEISLKIGEDRLFPAVRAAEAEAHILAPGTSCRHQIHDATQRKAVHPVVFMAEFLDERALQI